MHANNETSINPVNVVWLATINWASKAPEGVDIPFLNYLLGVRDKLKKVIVFL